MTIRQMKPNLPEDLQNHERLYETSSSHPKPQIIFNRSRGGFSVTMRLGNQEFDLSKGRFRNYSNRKDAVARVRKVIAQFQLDGVGYEFINEVDLSKGRDEHY